MATTIGSVIDYVLGNLGQSDVGEDRAAVFTDIVDLLTTDIPAEVGGYLLEGTALLPVGYTGSLSEDGVYEIPANVRAVSAVLALVDDVSISNPGVSTPWYPQCTYTNADIFYERYGARNAPRAYGKPQYALITGNQVTLRPVPKQTASPVWVGNVLLQGSVVQDLSSATEETVITNDRLVPCVRAGATLLYSVRERRTDITQLWSEIYGKRKLELQAMMSAFASNTQAPPGNF